MPLRDHFHPPVLHDCPWESFHATWVNALVQEMNHGLLPANYRAFPQIHMGTQVAVDVGTFRKGEPEADTGSGVATAVWAPAKAGISVLVEFADRDTFEVAVLDVLGRRLVAAIELVSPANKDRLAHRRDFCIKCASYLQNSVSLVVVDVVTNRKESLHRELATSLDLPRSLREAAASPLYAVAYRVRLREDDKRELEIWPEELLLEEALPTVPLWLADDLAVPVDLEESYQTAANTLRLE